MSPSTRHLRRRVVTGALAGGVLAGLGARLVSRYQHELSEARRRLAGVDRTVVTSAEFGTIEYAEHGEGEPVLMVHGIFQGCDGGILSARDLVVGRRVIAPSRFGYLGSALPRHATPPMQADAFAELLDSLHLDDIDVTAVSAGTTSALQLVLRHPERVRHLVVVSGNWPGSPTAAVQPPPARILYADPPLWVLKTVAPGLLARLMGVPKGLPLSAEDAAFVSAFADSIFPVQPRAAGSLFDAFVSNADVNSYPLEDIEVQTLVLHAADDPLASYDAATRAAERIPSATFVRIESGGHLLLGHAERARVEIATFLSASRADEAPRALATPAMSSGRRDRRNR